MTINPFIPIPVMVLITVLLIIMKRKGAWNFIRQIIIAILIFIINLRPMIPTDEIPSYSNNIDILFVVDNTISMLAEDYNGEERRMDGVRSDILKIVDDFEGARFALISFNDTAMVMSPYTTEKENIIMAASSLEGRSMNSASGSSINVVYNTLRDYLEGTYMDDDEEEEERIQLVFFISDGEMNTRDKLKSFDRLSEYIDGGAVLGYGTKSGGVMHVREYSSSEETSLLTYYEGGSQKTAVSKIDEKTLNQLADDMGLDYYHMEDTGDVWDLIDNIQAKIEAGEMTDSDEKGQGYDELYYIFAAILFALLIYELVYYGIKMGRGQ